MLSLQEMLLGDPLELIPSHHPLTPPHTVEDRVAWLRLLRSRRVGPSTFYRLMAEHGSAQGALKALPEIALEAGVKGYEICPAAVAEAELERADRFGARFLPIGAEDYPPLLAQIDCPPPILWVKGDLALLKRPTLSVVGTRNASSMGLRFVRKLCEELTQAGYVIASGLARGIDAAAHEAALEGGTIAVMAGGLDQLYPPENAALYAQICDSGVALSEQPFGMRPIARHFPQRNRIVAGLSLATLVIEAAARSGSLITAEDALKMGRDVMAVPGHPFDPRATGCNLLLRDGASLIRSARDVLESLPALQQASPPPQKRTAQHDLHQDILARLSLTPMSEDDLMRELGTSQDHVSRAIQSLELSGSVERHRGGKLARL